MAFTIDESSLLIKGRQGDTASFTFNFSQDMSAYTVHFYVKKNLNDAEALIEKEYANSTTGSITVNLTSTDTEKLTSKGSGYGVYYWGVKINNGIDFAQTIIPQEFKNPPMMYIYPEIGGS